MTGPFSNFVSLVTRKSPLQKKSLDAHLQRQDRTFWVRANAFIEKLVTLENVTPEYLVDSYLKLCKEMLAEQIKFKKTGRYSAASAREVDEKLYSTDAEMRSRVYALALTQFLWPNHYSLFDLFVRETEKLSGIHNYLEIGPGHGLHLIHAVRSLPESKFTVIDISRTSLEICKGIVSRFLDAGEAAKIEYIQSDVASYHEKHRRKYDYVVINEVLEHLDDPAQLLAEIRAILQPGGFLFITTCANAPAIDHVFLYDSVEHIQQQLLGSGYEIVTELAVPVGDFPRGEWADSKVEVNYSARLRAASR